MPSTSSAAAAARAWRSNTGCRLLGELPLDIRIREEADSGLPTVAADPGSARALAYRQMARRAAARLATLNKDYSSVFPKITVEAT